MKYSVDGLVIREMPASGENDKKIVLLTAERGKIFVTAKGAKSLRSPYANTTPLFTWGNYEITEREGYAWLSGASVTEPFYGLREDIERLALASYVLDVAYELSGEEAPAQDMLRLCLNVLYAISEEVKPRKLIKAVFELRAAMISGYEPMLGECCVCHRPRATYMYLDVMNGELKCAECLHKLEGKEIPAEGEIVRERILSPMGSGTLAVARYIAEAPVEKILSFTLDEASTSELARMSETYLLSHLERTFTSLDFYQSVSRKH